MTNGTQGSGPSGPKRPHATIEGKATEIKPEAPKPAAGAAPANPSTDQRATAEKVAGAAASVAAETKKTEPPKPAGTFTASSASKPGPAPTPPPSPPPSQRSGSAFGSIISHAVSGVVGGALVLLAAPLLGIGGPDATKAPPEVAQRIAALETAAKQASQPVVSPEVAKRLASLEQGVDQLKGITAAIPSLGEGQVRLDGETKAIKDQLASRTGPGSDAERLARMEERLSALAAAALADPKGAGPIPQLAQITGRIADLENALTNRLSAARRDMVTDIDNKLATTAEAAEAARSGTQRLDREVTTIKSDVTRTTQRVDQLKTGSDQLSEVTRSTQDEISRLRSALDSLRRETAKPADVSAAVAPAAARLAKLEASVAEVLKAEADRQSNAERIVLSLELGNLKRAIDRGGSYAAELAEVRKVAGNRLDLSVLQRYQDDGLPTTAELARQFRPLTATIIDADAEKQDASVVDRLMSGARTIVRVRKLTPDADDTSVEATVARMESALNDGRLADVTRYAKTLPPKSITGATRAWLDKVAARQAVEEAIVTIDRQLKSSLGAPPAASPKDAKQ
ncbi:MAG: hypothetical protein BGN89_08585 [Alphaproteobacteria bacterium 64-6]|nr:MAG: hypothetical protein BGN89_08585 [Alphaproteobacteria bacterium 64-6]